MSIFNHEFVVDGIRYRAVPDTKAAKISRKLHKFSNHLKVKSHLLGKGAEASKKRKIENWSIYLCT